MKYLVRTNCEYSIEIEAAIADEAMAKADKINIADWGQAWAPFEAEEEES